LPIIGQTDAREEFMRIATAFAVAAIAVVSFGATAVLAQQDPIAARKALMKANGQNAGAVAKMVKGEEPFDLAKVKAALDVFQNTAAKAPALFPPDSKTGGETAALPKIWEDMDDFKARFVKFGADAKAAEASITDIDTLKAAFPALGKNCGGCHELYRMKKS
jgi:cytochrome c556